MIRKTPISISVLAVFVFLVPSISLASTLNLQQASAIIGLLQAFNVDQGIVAQVANILGFPSTSSPSSQPGVPSPSTPSQPPIVPHVPPVGSPYISSSIGYDLSYNTTVYPSEGFGFAVTGVTGGKAFVHNARIGSEYQWAKFGSATRPTLYMNLNAPYGSAVSGHISAPKTCPPDALNGGSSSAPSTEPTACEGYNYGYNAAKDAYTYATGMSVTSPFWWLDIEEANSWSDDLAVNDAAIQGAIDYLNTQTIRVGLYSVPFMWRNIAGTTYMPTQMLGGNTISTPTWFPIGITNQVGAINTCSTISSFIPGSPVWIVQYEADSIAIDQNLAC